MIYFYIKLSNTKTAIPQKYIKLIKAW